MDPLLQRMLAEPERRQELIAAYQLRFKMLRCVNCGLAEHRTQVVPWSGPFPAQVAFIGEAPGGQEDQQGVPFVGPAGQLFDKLLVIAGLKREQVFVMNTVCCRPPGNRAPFPDEIRACQEWFHAQLDIARPTVIVCLGRTAVQQFRSITSLVKVAGRPFKDKGRIVIATVHPAAVLRNSAYMKQAVVAFKALRGVLEHLRRLPVDAYNPAQHLYAHLGKTVVTPNGPGQLVQVFQDRVAVVREGSTKVVFYDPLVIEVNGDGST